ncbi:hypothetical protein [Streptomyces sp. NPDC021020]|uniref:hypothetical protein n=1 Tax=Streptomyces sp. NPDC021020 TaxID=3365109 RepID=UPI0037892CAD
MVVSCAIDEDADDDRVAPLYTVETEDGPWRLRPEFLTSLGGFRPGMPPRFRSDLPEGTRVRIRGGPSGAAPVGEVTGLWWTTPFEPPKGYVVEVDGHCRCVTPDEIDPA